MNTEYFNLIDGSMEFNESKLIISDAAKRNKLNFILSIVSFTILGLSLLFKGIMKQDVFSIIIGSLLICVWIMLFIKERRDMKNTISEIYLSDVMNVTSVFDQTRGFISIILHLRSGDYRKVKLVIENDQDQRLKQLFTSHKIETL